MPLERGIAVGVLHEQPGGVRAVGRDHGPPGPADVRDHLPEPGQVLGVDRRHLLGAAAVGSQPPPRSLVALHPPQQFGAQFLVHATSMGPAAVPCHAAGAAGAAELAGRGRGTGGPGPRNWRAGAAELAGRGWAAEAHRG